jgi:hypothetical protein
MNSSAMLALAILAPAILALASAQLPEGCSQISECRTEIAACFLDAECLKKILCLANCGFTDAECAFTCGMANLDNQIFLDFLQCNADIGCLPSYPEEGECLATWDEALQDVTDIADVEGSWWVLKGQNCGQEGWPGGYDGYPCQNCHYKRVEGTTDQWINNQTYCSGANNVCTSPYFVTIADLSLLSPGVVRGDYPLGQAPVVPQIEDWHWLSMPHPDWALAIWCGYNPALVYNGGLLVSKHRSMALIPPEVEAELRLATARFGMDYDAMCESDNSNCPNGYAEYE